MTPETQGQDEEARAWEEARLARYRANTDRIVAQNQRTRAWTHIQRARSRASIRGRETDRRNRQVERYLAMVAFAVGIVATLILSLAMGDGAAWRIRISPLAVSAAGALRLRALTPERKTWKFWKEMGSPDRRDSG